MLIPFLLLLIETPPKKTNEAEKQQSITRVVATSHIVSPEHMNSSCDRYYILNHIISILMNDIPVNVDPSYYGGLACPSGSLIL